MTALPISNKENQSPTKYCYACKKAKSNRKCFYLSRSDCKECVSYQNYIKRNKNPKPRQATKAPLDKVEYQRQKKAKKIASKVIQKRYIEKMKKVVSSQEKTAKQVRKRTRYQERKEEKELIFMLGKMALEQMLKGLELN
jgi:hypothetical protein